MSNYLKTTNFTAKDSLTSGDPAKKIVGSEFDTEFDALQTAIASKADLASPALTGIPTAPTASAGTSTAQLATTAFVQAAIGDVSIPSGTMASQNANNVAITGGSVTGITDITIADGGTGASTAADARTNLGVPANDGTNATGTWGISITGAAASIPDAAVASSVAGLAYGAVGTYVFAHCAVSVAPGGTTSGSNLSPAGVGTTLTSGASSSSGAVVSSSSLSGTWRCMGNGQTFQTGEFGEITNYSMTLWLRIS